jgi:DNA-binding helix-hairpin-helix protein with protein kinase domain
MQAVTFNKEMVRTRQTILWVFLLQVILLITGGLLYFFGRRSTLTLVIVVSSLALVLYCLALTILWIIYLRQPEVKEKYRLQNHLKQNDKESHAARVEITGADQRAESIRRKAQVERHEHQVLFDANAAALDEHIKDLRQSENAALEAALEKLHNARLSEALKDIPFDDTLVPGIGPVLGEKLRENGIQTALDIRNEPLKRIPGIGNSKATSLLRWRESLEAEIKKNQPVELPAEERQAIAARFASQISAQQDEKNTLNQNHAKRLDEINAKETQQLAEIAGAEADARIRLSSLETRRQELQEELKAFTAVTFIGLLSSALSNPDASWLRRVGSSLFLVLLAIAGTLNVLLLLAALVKQV